MPAGWLQREARLVASVLVVLTFCGNAVAQTEPGKPETEKPNIIFILADDLGYGDLGCYGQKSIKTPYLDQMAKAGVRFTNHYSGSTVCAPSRCCLLTGQHTGHVNVRGNTDVLIPDETATVAKLLKQAGYKTGAIGKWGVGHPPPPGDPARNGFDHFFGYLDMWHAHNFYPDFLWKNGEKFSVKGNIVKAVKRGGVALKKTQYSHDLFAQDALDFIEKNQQSPFFLYLPFTIPHANNEAGAEGMEVPDDRPYSAEDWPQAQKNHAAMITRLDETVGQILLKLKTLKLDQKTLVIFTSDNGPHSEGGADPKFFQSSGMLRGQKRDLYEGGIRVPFVATWPGKIQPGTISHHVSTFWDFLPTACELAGEKPPEKIDGISYLPSLLGQPGKQQKHKFLYWEFHEGGSKQAVRMGDWKAVVFCNQTVELYNLQTDPAETIDVAQKYPEVIEQIGEYLLTARVDSDQFPLKTSTTKGGGTSRFSFKFVSPRRKIRLDRKKRRDSQKVPSKKSKPIE